MMKRAVVTGASGMIGATLIRQLIDRGIEVLAIVRPGSLKAENIPQSPLVVKVECSLASLPALTIEALPHTHYDVFFHLAWDGVSGAARNDSVLQTNNILNALDAVNLAHRLNCTVFVGAGSQAEYGRVSQKLRSDTPVNPENGYGIAKYAAGKLCALQARQMGLRFNWVRILSVYGPMDNQGSVITSTIHKLLKGEPLQFTKGEQVWDFIFSQDAARALYMIGISGRDGAVYPIGSGESRLLRDYLADTCRIVDPNALPSFGDLPYPAGQVMYLCADIQELHDDTGFSPRVPFAEGIRITADWYREKMGLK